MLIPFVKLAENAIAPTHNNVGDAGLDFYSIDDVFVDPHDFELISTGIRVQIPEGHVGLLYPRGKNDHLIGSGVIDTYYEGEIIFKIINPYKTYCYIPRGYGVGQMVIVPFVEPMPLEIQTITSRNPERGSSGGIMKNFQQYYHRRVV